MISAAPCEDWLTTCRHECNLQLTCLVNVSLEHWRKVEDISFEPQKSPCRKVKLINFNSDPSFERCFKTFKQYLRAFKTTASVTKQCQKTEETEFTRKIQDNKGKPNEHQRGPSREAH